MSDSEFQMLELLLRKFRDEAVDREEFDKRESVRFDVEFECKIRGLSKVQDQTTTQRTPDE